MTKYETFNERLKDAYAVHKANPICDDVNIYIMTIISYTMELKDRQPKKYAELE